MITIATMLHKLQAQFPDNPDLEYLSTLPHYVLDWDLVTHLPAHTLAQSLTALRDVGMFTLPFPTLLVELWAGNPDRIFGIIKQVGPNNFSAIVLPFSVGVDIKPLPIRLSWATKAEILAETHALPADPIRVFDATKPDQGIQVVTAANAEAGFRAEVPPNWPNKIVGGLASELATALSIILVLPHVAGLEREVITPTKLNKARRACGKSQIHTHTVVRLGHVYDQSGRAHAVTGKVRHQSIHMRAAHVRRQAHGPKFLAANPAIAALPTTTADHHLVLVPAVLVNYKDGANLEVPLPKLVKY